MSSSRERSEALESIGEQYKDEEARLAAARAKCRAATTAMKEGEHSWFVGVEEQAKLTNDQIAACKTAEKQAAVVARLAAQATEAERAMIEAERAAREAKQGERRRQERDANPSGVPATPASTSLPGGGAGGGVIDSVVSFPGKVVNGIKNTFWGVIGLGDSQSVEERIAGAGRLVVALGAVAGVAFLASRLFPAAGSAAASAAQFSANNLRAGLNTAKSMGVNFGGMR